MVGASCLVAIACPTVCCSHRRLRTYPFGRRLGIVVARITPLVENQALHMYRRIAWPLVSAPMSALATDGNVDSSFFKDAAEGGIAEVDIGKVAQATATARL